MDDLRKEALQGRPKDFFVKEHPTPMLDGRRVKDIKSGGGIALKGEMGKPKKGTGNDLYHDCNHFRSQVHLIDTSY